MSFGSEFREFAMRGNVVDLAIGVVIGAAFGKVVSSLVNGIIMPPIGLLIGGVNFDDLKLTMKDAVLAADGSVVTEAVTLNYGAFGQTILDFLIIAFAIFMVIKAMNRMKRKQDADPAEPAHPSEEVQLLREIRDSLMQGPRPRA